MSYTPPPSLDRPAPRRRFGSVIVRRRIAGTTGQADLAGERFGRLVAIRSTDKRKHGTVVWECECDCGGTCEVPLVALTNGHRKSCGCIGRRTGPVALQPLRRELWDREAWEPIDEAIAKGWGEVPWPCIYRAMRDNGGVLPSRDAA